MPTDFYQRLPVRDRFTDVTNPEAFEPVPDDWYVALSDVAGSTVAIAEGRYKAVNLIGASSIVALLNLEPGTDFPFVFGGDGATFLLPPCLEDPAQRTLAALRRRAADEFGLTLRVGMVPVRDVRANGYDIRVARLRLTDDCHQAMFDGGGLAHADALVKDPTTATRYAVPDRPDAHADFSGLECRWQDLHSPHGETVTLLVRATSDAPGLDRATYASVLARLFAIYGDASQHRPIATNVLRTTFDPRYLMGETVLLQPTPLRRMLHLARITMENALLRVLVRFRLTTHEGTHWPSYIDKLIASSDFRKYDDMLRMVIAGTPEQRHALTAYLDAEHQAGRLAYGLHVADRALMTCAVFERMGRQVHFVDGADGGYALAARALKQQLQTRKAAAA